MFIYAVSSVITPCTHYFYLLPWGPCFLALIESSFKRQAHSPASLSDILLMVTASHWKACFSSTCTHFGGCGIQLHTGWRAAPEASSLFPDTHILVVRLRAFKAQPFCFWHCGAFLVRESICWVFCTCTYPMLIPRASVRRSPVPQLPLRNFSSALVHLREVSEGSRATYTSLVLEKCKVVHIILLAIALLSSDYWSDDCSVAFDILWK